MTFAHKFQDVKPKKINKKMYRSAMRSIWSKVAEDNKLVAVNELNIDEDEFKNYLMNKENIEPLANEEIQARKMGINSVPTFIVNQQIVINGAQSVDNFELIFTKLLSKVH